MRRSFTPVTLALILLLVGLLVLQGTATFDDEDGAPDPGPWSARATAADARPQLGVTTQSLARNAFEAWEPDDLAEVNRFEHAARARADIVVWFADWEHNREFDADQARAIAARGAVPEISWEPWDASVGTYREQPRYRLATIIAGEHDALLRRWGRGIAAYGGPVRIRFAHEMNGRWYPWAERFNDNRPGEFVRAWRHVRRVVREAGATNVEWIWCPVTGQVPERLFPGGGEVDILGLSGFNGGVSAFSRRWRPFRLAFNEALDDLHALAPELPVELSEISSAEAGGDKAAWIGDMFEEIADRPYVRSLVWFEVVKEADWRIVSSAAASRAFAAGLREARAAAAAAR